MRVNMLDGVNAGALPGKESTLNSQVMVLLRINSKSVADFSSQLHLVGLNTLIGSKNPIASFTRTPHTHTQSYEYSPYSE